MCHGGNYLVEVFDIKNLILHVASWLKELSLLVRIRDRTLGWVVVQRALLIFMGSIFHTWNCSSCKMSY